MTEQLTRMGAYDARNEQTGEWDVTVLVFREADGHTFQVYRKRGGASSWEATAISREQMADMLDDYYGVRLPTCPVCGEVVLEVEESEVEMTSGDEVIAHSWCDPTGAGVEE